jgi:Flp pilus assembly pilin Flp
MLLNRLPNTMEPSSDGRNKLPRRRGATAIEYVFTASLIIAVCVGVINVLGGNVGEKLQQAHDALFGAD